MTARAIGLILVRRLGALVVVLVLISFGIFSLLYLAPGNIVQTLIGDQPATPQLIAVLRHQYHLDQPFLAQFWFWLEHAARLDFGHSSTTGLSVTQTIRERLALSFELGLFAFVIIVAVGFPLGVLAALRKRSAVDRAAVGLSVVGVSTPAFVTGIALLYLLAVRIHWFPAFGGGSTGLTSRISHLTLPAITLALGNTAIVVKLTRVGMLEALDQDYVAFARARGLRNRRVIRSYALRNALIPVVTASGLMLGYLLTAAVLVDVVFSLPGLGSLLVDSVDNKDVPTIQGLALVIATTVVLANLIVDLLYLVIDPRIRFEAEHRMTQVALESKADVGVSRAPRLRHHFSLLQVLCLIVLALVIVCAVFGPLVAPHDPSGQNLLLSSSNPSAHHWFGTDTLGRDIFSRVVVGARYALIGPALIAFFAMLIGVVVGTLAGYHGGRVDSWAMRCVDVMWSIPGLLVAIVVVGVIGGGYWNAVTVLIVLTAPWDVRLIRGATLEQRPRPYVEAVRALGLPHRKVMFGHIFPNTLPVVVANSFLNFAHALVALAALSFLGLGVPPGTADWGRMLSENRPLLLQNPVAALAPGVAIVIVATVMNLLGDFAYERLADRGRAR